MLSQSYKDGFGDGWSDTRDQRTSTAVITNDYYGREYSKGYDAGAGAYARRLEGRFGAFRETTINQEA